MHALLSRFAPQPLRHLPARRLRRSPGAADDAPLCCGWFDSSHELQQGLHICEVPVHDLPVHDLPVHDLLLGALLWPAEPPSPIPS
jgi:hypothetical protein